MNRAGRRGGEGSAHARSLAEALERCAHHGHGGLLEGLAALRAGVDAASFLLFRCAADEGPLDPFWMLVDELRSGLARGRTESESLLRALSEALDVEGARWEEWGRDDPEARAVFRAFVELRSLLREFGMPNAEPRRPTPRRPGTQKPHRRSPRSV